MVRGAVGAAAGSLLLGSGRWSSQAVVLRFINEQGRELDRVVFTRVAGGVA